MSTNLAPRLHAPGLPPEAALQAVAEREALQRFQRRLEAVSSWLAADLGAVEAALSEIEGADRAWQSAGHLLALGGKRLRPICVLLAARLGPAPRPEAARLLAAACELIHTATLLHDDVVDLAETRRHAPAACVVFGNAASVLGGDYLLVEALRRVRQARVEGALDSLLDTLEQMVAAEARQLEARGTFHPDADLCRSVMHGKTGALFAWSLRAGGTAGGLRGADLEALSRAGGELGVAFQVVDDLLDLTGDPERTGKDALRDVAEGKLTWPLHLACAEDPTLVRALRAVAHDPDSLDPPALRQQILDTGCVEPARAYARDLIRAARRRIAGLPEGPARAHLGAVVELALQRSC